jgi:hypothetical protein
MSLQIGFPKFLKRNSHQVGILAPSGVDCVLDRDTDDSKKWEDSKIFQNKCAFIDTYRAKKLQKTKKSLLGKTKP